MAEPWWRRWGPADIRSGCREPAGSCVAPAPYTLLSKLSKAERVNIMVTAGNTRMESEPSISTRTLSAACPCTGHLLGTIYTSSRTHTVTASSQLKLNNGLAQRYCEKDRLDTNRKRTGSTPPRGAKL
ncbi:predicted protein [Chaetomium globosum CBS 148.51]|uniref:Uncharacterized protein n=1 Tax=Chaetomium globosum (strain ATCC 6205 / CBS 148.51 / DSM 1962 / NBRC 6347 / NRRL 1970) TaxID=306901 RepID=Q2GVQ8_CHAGB|nr:uncharacterized protein CHGG_07946 [Chaetomium globosum CBS 148.51]EAQ86693.1 predicted protein [Chaetomium globosum CBS 148.51]